MRLVATARERALGGRVDSPLTRLRSVERGSLPPLRLPEHEPGAGPAAVRPSLTPGAPTGEQADLRQFLAVLKRRKWVVLACMTLIPIATFFASSSLPKTYEASVIVQVQASAIDTSLFEASSGATAQQSPVVAATAKLAQTPALAVRVGRELGGTPPSPTSLLAKTSVETDETSGFLTIHVRDRDPVRTAEIANAFGRAIVAARADQARSQIRRTIGALTRQIASLKPSHRTADPQLSQELQHLRAVEAAQGDNAQILAPASVPKSAASPRPIRDTVFAIILAVLLSVALAFALERLNRRIRSAYDFEELTGAPLLGTVPASAFQGRDPASTHEAFQMIRATLLYFNPSQKVKTILVNSPSAGEGKTTVAVNLAISLARSGKKVILVDCDLRRPQIASRLQLNDVEYGLAEILSKERPINAGLVEVRREDATLHVLPAGGSPVNPSELLSSSRMRGLLQYLTVQADFVVLDSTPLLRVSDVIPLLPQVSGVVGLARVDQTRRDEIRRFQEVVALSGGVLLGIVASGVRADRKSYGYGYGALPRPDNGPARSPHVNGPSAHEDGSAAASAFGHKA